MNLAIPIILKKLPFLLYVTVFVVALSMPIASLAQTTTDYAAQAQQYLKQAQAAQAQAQQYLAQAQAEKDPALAQQYATQAASAEAQANSYMAQYYDAKTHVDTAQGNAAQAQADAAQAKVYAAETSAASNITNGLAQNAQSSQSSAPSGNASAVYFIPLTQLPGLKDIAGNQGGLAGLLNTLYGLCIGAAAAIAMLQIMRAGLMWMSAGDSAETISKAKGLISSSIFGIILVLSPYIVFNIINPGVLSLNIANLGSLAPNTQTTQAPQQTPTTPVQSVIQSTGKANPACTPFKDGQQISPDGTDEQCCVNQTPGTWSNIWDYTSQPYKEYCVKQSS